MLLLYDLFDSKKLPMTFLSLFGADKISMDLIHQVEQRAPNLIVWAVPAMVLFSALEMYISYRQDRKFYEKKEISNERVANLENKERK